MVADIASSIERAKEADKKPRVHPNGFIQLDLSQDQRLHIWPDISLPAPEVLVPIHDHTFSFESEVLVGSITNIIYNAQADEEGDHRLFEVAPYLAKGKQSSFVLKDGRRYRVEAEDEFIVGSGDAYSFEPFKLHETVVEEFTATVITVSPAFDRNKLARVACSFPLYPDGTFSRDQVDEELLWQEINKTTDKSRV